MRRPGQMLRHQRRLVARNELAEARKVRPVEGSCPADRHADAMQRQWMIAAYGLERAMRGAAGAHIVLGMDFEEAMLRTFGEDRRKVLMLEACSREPTDPRRKAERHGRRLVAPGRRGHSAPPLSVVPMGWPQPRQIGLSEPCLPFGSSMLAQVPPWTNFHALPWKSAVDVPWQVVPGPAAQSIWALNAAHKKIH